MSILLSLTFVLTFALTQSEPAVHTEPDPAGTLNVMTFNIRYNNPEDGINAWPHRKEAVADLIAQKYQADLAGLQEALKGQIDDLAQLMPQYGWIGVGREDGKEKGEFSPIFYKKDRLELLESRTFWLSETPEVPGSKSWDSSLPRIATWGKFRDRKTGSVFYHFNTHFDHIGQTARTESARLLGGRILALAGDTPTVLTGDFNSREKSEAYRLLTGQAALQESTKSDLQDARYLSNHGHQGPTSTTTNWVEHGEPETKIDFIFVRGAVEVLYHAVPDDKYDNRYPSDHLPVLAKLEIVSSSTKPAVDKDDTEEE